MRGGAGLIALVTLLAACGGQKDDGQGTKTAPASEAKAAAPATEVPKEQRLVVYSGRGAVLVEKLLAKFQADTGIKLDVRYGGGTQELADQLATEGAQTTADVFLAQDSGYLGALAKAGHLRALPQNVLDQVEPRFRDAGGKWVGTSGRARVLVYNPEKLKPEDLPRTLEALADPKYKGRFGWAPTNASFQSHVSGLRHAWGEEKARAWLEKMKAIEPAAYPKNSPIVTAVGKGEIDLGWVNHYYLLKQKATEPDIKAANYAFPEAGDPGNVMMVSGVGVTTHSKNPELAEKLVAYLVSEDAQKYFTNETFEYPTRPGLPAPEGAPAMGDKLATIDQAALTDLAPTLELLKSLNLL
jgi:iron(III) transport system substrate-binding protein